MQLTEMQRGVRDQFRKYMETELAPKDEAFENNDELTYDFIRKMVADLGLDRGADEAEKTGKASLGLGGSNGDDGDQEMKDLVRYAGAQIAIEMSRVNAGVCMNWGVTIGLVAGKDRAGPPRRRASARRRSCT